MAPQRRALGSSGITIAPLMFGGNVFGWTADAAMSFRLLDAFLDAGFDAIDTADVYSRWVPGHTGGESEAILGAWMKARGVRHRVMLATKCGSDMGPAGKGLHPDHIGRAVEASLQRLGTDHIDLYQAHRPDPETPIADTLGAFARLVEQGKVRAIGTSNESPAQLREALETSRALGLPAFVTTQPRYNLHDRADFEAGLQPVCVEHGVAVIPFYSLAAGFLTGKYRRAEDAVGKTRGGMMKQFLTPRGLGILAALDDVGARFGATPAEVSLAWLLTRPALAAPIASATTQEQLASLLRGVTLTLDAEALATLDAASA